MANFDFGGYEYGNTGNCEHWKAGCELARALLTFSSVPPFPNSHSSQFPFLLISIPPNSHSSQFPFFPIIPSIPFPSLLFSGSPGPWPRLVEFVVFRSLFSGESPYWVPILCAKLTLNVSTVPLFNEVGVKVDFREGF